MSKVWLEFDPCTDEDELYMAQNGLKFYSALREIDEMCRRELKHGECTETSLVDLVATIRQTIGSVEP